MKRTRRLPWVAEVQWRKRSLEVRENAGAVQMGYLVVRPYGSWNSPMTRKDGKEAGEPRAEVMNDWGGWPGGRMTATAPDSMPAEELGMRRVSVVQKQLGWAGNQETRERRQVIPDNSLCRKTGLSMDSLISVRMRRWQEQSWGDRGSVEHRLIPGGSGSEDKEGRDTELC